MSWLYWAHSISTRDSKYTAKANANACLQKRGFGGESNGPVLRPHGLGLGLARELNLLDIQRPH